jgi:hypothetical protein
MTKQRHSIEFHEQALSKARQRATSKIWLPI